MENIQITNNQRNKIAFSLLLRDYSKWRAKGKTESFSTVCHQHKRIIIQVILLL